MMTLKKSLLCLALGLLLAMGASTSHAKDNDVDLFKELEQEATPDKKGGDDTTDLFNEMKQETPPPKPSKFEPIKKLADNLGGYARFRYIRYLRGVEERNGADTSYDHYDYILGLNTFTNGKKWRLDLDGWAEGGNQANTFGGYTRWFQDTQRDTVRHFELNEVYLTINQPSFDFLVGKKVFKNGLSTLYSPADRMRPQIVHDPFDPKDIGLFQTRIDYYWKSYSFTGAYFPVYQAGKNWPDSSRWSGSTRNNNNRDSEHRNDNNVEDEYPNINFDSMGYFIRAKTTLRGWDVFASMYQGPNPYSVIRQENRGGTPVKIKTIVNVGNYAAGFSTTYKKWEIHGEALFNWSYDGKDDDYFNYVGGFTYTIDDWAKRIFLQRIDITLEYAGEWLVAKQSAANYTDSSRDSRSGRNDIYSRITFKYNDDWRFRYASNVEFTDSGWYNHFEVEYKISRWDLTCTLVGETFSGSENSYYGRWWRNDRIYTMFKYAF